MMTKSEVASFLSTLARPAKDAGKSPAVVLVHADRRTKQFVAQTLEQLEPISDQLKRPSAKLKELREVEQTLQELERHALALNFQNIALAIRYTELLTVLIASWSSELFQDRTTKLSRLMALLSAMLLRVYVDGNDEKCHEELEKIRVLMQAPAPDAHISEGPAPRKAPAVVN